MHLSARRFRGLQAFLLVFALFFAGIAPAQARVTIAFWSQEMGSNFPHAFFTMKGRFDRGGPPVDVSYGFTVKALTPAILFGTIAGKIDRTTKSFIDASNVHFSLEISDAQADAVLKMLDDWGENGDHHYNMNKRNCVHFVAEAMRRSGLKVVEDPKLMKKPRSFSQSIERLNKGRVTVLEMPAKQYWARLEAKSAQSAAQPR